MQALCVKIVLSIWRRDCRRFLSWWY